MDARQSGVPFHGEGELRYGPDLSVRAEIYRALFATGAVSNRTIARLENLPDPPIEVYAVAGDVTLLRAPPIAEDCARCRKALEADLTRSGEDVLRKFVE